MYVESEIGDMRRVQLTCDRNCKEAVEVYSATHEQAQWQLYVLGWRLYRGKQLCPKHARVVSKRLERESAKALSV